MCIRDRNSCLPFSLLWIISSERENSFDAFIKSVKLFIIIKIKNCASIYGTQGFEVDYAGFIWGRDFVIRNGKWEIGSHCEDFPSVARPDTLKYLIEQEADDPVKKEIAMTLLKNRLRIFLSRGIKGTYVFCEDDETRKFLIQNYVN